MTATPTNARPTNTRLTNARLPDGRTVNVTVDDEGRIGSVGPAGATDQRPDRPGPGSTVHDLGGWLLLPALAEPHAHLDKALTADLVPNPAGDLMGAIDAWVTAAGEGRITREGITERAGAALELLLVRGVTAVRTHVNVTASIGATALKAVQEAAARFEGLMDIQTVALTSSPMVGRDASGNRAALVEALEVGVDLVGGCPHLEDDGPGLIANAIAAATEAGIGIDLHTDEMLDPSVLTLRDVARQVIDSGFSGPAGPGGAAAGPMPVAASHCVTLGMQAPEVQAEVSALVAEANMAVFPLPQTNLFLQGRDHPTGTPRGLTAVAALTEAGVLVAAGGDNVQDPFNLVGRSDPLETAALMVMAGHQLPERAYEMVSNNVRRAMGLEPVTIEPGSPADLLAIDAPSIRGAIADAPMSRRVFRRGRLVASSDQSSTIHR